MLVLEQKRRGGDFLRAPSESVQGEQAPIRQRERIEMGELQSEGAMFIVGTPRSGTTLMRSWI